MKDADRQLMMGWILLIESDVATQRWFSLVCGAFALVYFWRSFCGQKP